MLDDRWIGRYEMSALALPAVRESEATGEVGAIFADLRQTLDVPFVNFIWRHLATIPEMLAWTWRASKPLYTSLELSDATTELQKMIRTPGAAEVPHFVHNAIGLTTSQMCTISRLITAYNKANASNLAALLVVLALLRGHATRGRGFRLLDPSSTSITCPVPPLPQLSDLAGPLQELIRSLDEFGRVAPSNQVASLYCHLAYWPPFLGIVHTALLPAHQSGELRNEQIRLLKRAKELAATRLLPMIESPSLPREENLLLARTAMEIFTEQMIVRLLVVGTAMLEILPNQRAT